MSTRDHWQGVYASKAATDVSWYAAHLRESLRLIQEVSSLDARIVDVGAGASTLVDDLLDLGYRNVTLLDVSEAALAITRARLGTRGDLVRWLVADITTARLDEHCFDLWHDRAVFHFLTSANDRRAYVQALGRSLVPGGNAVLSTFSLAGPAKCSGLDVVRYDADALAHELGADLDLTAQAETVHTTPAGNEQRFLVCRFKKRF